MSEPENQGTPPTAETEAAPEPFKKRDEKGLTLGMRLMLRAAVEQQRILRSASLLRSDTSLANILAQETMMDVLDDLLFFATQMGEKLGDVSVVKAHLAVHEEDDEKQLIEIREANHRKKQEEYAKRSGAGGLLSALVAARAASGSPGACDVCGRPLCADCGHCHHHDGDKKPEPLN